ncbi:MAG TPA: lytic transglycosylase domain-containing protein [Longimicrobium sp.]|jgi:soluble lytic murein transglycosylase
MKFSSELVRYAGFAGIATGLAIGTAWGRGDVRESLSRITTLEAPAVTDPFAGLSHAGMTAAAREASAELESGRPWAAWNELRCYVEDEDDAPPAVALLAARAAAGWDAWSHVRRLLAGREWLDEEGGGAGLLLLARAEEAREEWEAAAAAYRRYTAVAEGEARGVASARLGRVLRRAERPREAAGAFADAARDLPQAADWLLALRAEALAAAGDPAAVSAPLPAEASAPARAHRARAEARYWLGAGDTVRAAAGLEAEAGAVAALDARTAAELALKQARLLAAAGHGPEARAVLARVAADGGAAPTVRSAAAALLGDLPGERTAAEQLARAAAYEAAGKPGLAAKALRVALARGAPDDAATRLRVGRLLFDEADYEPARAWLLEAAEKLDAERAAEAELYAARALVRLGRADDGRAALRRLAERRAGTAAAGTAWFLLGDEAADRATGIVYYRRAAEVAHSPHAREALFRVGDRSRKEGETAAAIRAWEEYAGRWPQGEQTAEAAYQAGLLHERAGREERARAMYAAAIAADPVSYPAVRAADRMGADPLAGADRALPWPAAPADEADAAAALRRLRALEEAGLEDAWKAELDAQVRRLGERPLARLVLAEGLRDAGHPVDGIRLGRALLEERGGAWDARLLRVVFPFPYRELLLDEAERVDVDPWLLAGLVRQESSFDRRARSWVGATGLSQIMPGTGAWLAGGVGIRNFEPELLAVPEINLRMGARYLRDQMRRYRGARDLALAAYNAGPGRADRWKRELGYGRDVDAFREQIPFAETRHYVKVVIRNAEVYRRLYGPRRAPGLASPEM